MRVSRREQATRRDAVGIEAWISKTLHGLQGHLAVVLNAKGAHLSSRSKKIGLALFCLSFGSLSILALASVLQTGSVQIKVALPAQLTVPGYFIQEETTVPSFTNDDFKNIRLLKSHLDSLQASPRGRKIYDSIMRYRPGFVDSLRQLETNYSSPLKH